MPARANLHHTTVRFRHGGKASLLETAKATAFERGRPVLVVRACFLLLFVLFPALVFIAAASAAASATASAAAAAAASASILFT